MELISVIMPSYNSERYIKETIDSILAQTYRNWELIVVDDCSTDETYSIIEEYSKNDCRIKCFRLDSNSGPGVSRNFALKKAKGNFISFLDSDDLWSREKLSRQYDFMKKENCPISYTSYSLIDSIGQDMNKLIKVKGNPLTLQDYLKNTIIGFSTSMINKNITGDIEITSLRSREDTLLWIQLLDKGFYALGLDENLTRYRIHDNSISANKFESAKLVWKLYKDNLKCNFLKRLYYFSFYALNAFKKHI